MTGSQIVLSNPNDGNGALANNLNSSETKSAAVVTARKPYFSSRNIIFKETSA